MISSNDFRNGVTIELEGKLLTVVEFQHVKPGKGSAFVRTKLRDLKSGYVIEKTFRGGEKLVRANIENREMQFLYHSDNDYTFMDTSSYEQVTLTADHIGDCVKWLKDGTMVSVMFHGNLALGVEVPNFVELRVTETEPGFKGDTATGSMKNATVETGAVVQVPLFVTQGDTLQIDTRTGQYLRRV